MYENILKPNKNGFICNWLISGPRLSTPEITSRQPNQLKFENDMRQVIADDLMAHPPEEIALGKTGLGNSPWKYYHAGQNWFVDVSSFVSELAKVELFAFTQLVSDMDRVIDVRVWTYGAIDLWLNNINVCKIKTPVYKPINYQDITLKLKKGTNDIFIRMQNLGVRDTRNIFGVQLKEDIGGLTIILPDSDGRLAPLIGMDLWLMAVKMRNGKMLSENIPPEPVEVIFLPRTAHEQKKLLWSKTNEFQIPDKVEKITMVIEISGQLLVREIEISENIRPSIFKLENVDIMQHRKDMIKEVANIEAQPRGEGIRFSVHNVLARYALGAFTERNIELLFDDLELVDRRIDCADFVLAGILRLFLKYDIENEQLKLRMKEVCTNFRYWMDEKGSDAMCFWSENHALLFFGCQMIAGNMFPNDIFIRSGITGSEQAEIGAKRCREWLDSVEKDGFDEFLATGYTCVTAGAILNLIDFGDDEISLRATKVLDSLLYQLAKHTFDGSVIGPQGRVYRGVLYPFKTDVLALLHYITPEVNKGYSMWLGDFASTKYQFPEDLAVVMHDGFSETYSCANAEITIEKNMDYILTSVSSPKVYFNKDRTDEVSNTSDTLYQEKFSYDSVKALNEKFHGTTRFEPGVYGYQQHLWYAALSGTCPVFVNHPGGTHEKSSMRPGYWYGNGILPALKQKGNMLGAVYLLSEEHPINFTHLYWPSQEFDEVKQEDKWLFGRKSNSYVAVWCNCEYVPHDDVIFNREYRAYGEKIAYLCMCSSKEQSGGFSEFINETRIIAPIFEERTMTLETANGFSVIYQHYENRSQII